MSKFVYLVMVEVGESSHGYADVVSVHKSEDDAQREAESSNERTRYHYYTEAWEVE